MADELVFYTNPMSRGRVARWMLEEVGQPYRTVLLDFARGAKAPEYLALNPMGKVPTIVHGRTVVTECAAVCAYLADAFPEAGLAPEPARRGAYYRWMFFAAGPIEAAVTNRAMGFEVPPEREGAVGYGSFGRVMDTIERAVAGGGYIAGDRFSAADVYFGSALGWGLRFGTIEARPGVAEYWARISGRPAAVRAREIDDAALAAAKAEA